MPKEVQKRRRMAERSNLAVLLLLAGVFLTVYTLALQKNYSNRTLKESVRYDTECSDQIHQTVSDLFTEADYANINSIEDMKTERYHVLQSRLNDLRMLRSVRYLYTAKRNDEGKLVYLIDGLNLSASDFAYPGTLIESEMIPYISTALSGQTVYSQEIMDTTWGHIFTACYPVYEGEKIIGALCIEMDMESTYESIEAINHSALWIAASGVVLAAILIISIYISLQRQKKKDAEYQRILEETAAKAQAANKAKSTFLFNMSHDLRTPMNAILGYSDLAGKHLDDPQRLQEYMENIHVSGENLLSIINNVLELARIENNETVVEENVSRTGDNFDACIVMFQTSVAKKSQRLIVDKQIHYPYIYTDGAHMSEIFLNILSNAVKYTGEGGSIHCALNQYPGEKEGWCVTELSVEDNGIGMSQEFQQHIFEAFTRERTSTVSGVEGTGLGMGIVKKLVDLMNGTIEVESSLGKGTRFTVRIPCRIASEADAIAKRATYHVDQTSVRGKRILLVEDNDLNAEIAMELLAEEGLLADRAEDGVVCVSMLEKAPAHYYDLILMDIQMPVMNGYKATQVIRALDDPEKACIPIVAMTANAFAEDRKKALEVGMNDHVAKPIDMNTLMKVLEKQMHIRLIQTEEPVPEKPQKKRIQDFEELRRNAMADRMPGGFFVYEAYGEETLLYANGVACAIWGCRDFEELKELAGNSFRGLVHPDDIDWVEESIVKQVAEDENGMDRVDYRIIRKDGTVCWVDDYGRLLRTDQDHELFYVFVADTTEKHITRQNPEDNNRKH